MVYQAEDQKSRFLKRMGADIRRMREEAGLSLDQLSRVLTPDRPNRDRLSKVERGLSGIDFPAYLELMWYLRTYIGEKNHPGIELARRYLTPENRESIDP